MQAADLNRRNQESAKKSEAATEPKPRIHSRDEPYVPEYTQPKFPPSAQLPRPLSHMPQVNQLQGMANAQTSKLDWMDCSREVANDPKLSNISPQQEQQVIRACVAAKADDRGGRY